MIKLFIILLFLTTSQLKAIPFNWGWQALNKDLWNESIVLAKEYNESAKKYKRHYTKEEIDYFLSNGYAKLFNIVNDDYVSFKARNKSDLTKEEIIDINNINCEDIKGKKFDKNNVDFVLCPLKDFNIDAKLLKFNAITMTIIKSIEVIDSVNNYSANYYVCKRVDEGFEDVKSIYYLKRFYKPNQHCEDDVFLSEFYTYLKEGVAESYLIGLSGINIVESNKNIEPISILLAYYIFVKPNGDYRVFYINLDVSRFSDLDIY